MARVRNSQPGLNGRVGDLIYYERHGVRYARCRPRPYKTATPSQLAARNSFRECSLMYKFLCPELLLPWKMQAASAVMNGRNLFIGRNIHAFNSGNDIPDFERLHFSCGQLLNPDGLSCTFPAKGQCSLTWEYDSTERWTSPEDRLCVVELHTGNPFSPLLIRDLTACRKDGRALISTRQSMGAEVHLYCFFASPDYRIFSESRYFKGGEEDDRQ